MRRLSKGRGSLGDIRVTDLKEGLVLVNEVPTLVITYGGWIDEAPTTPNKKIIVLVIPGNPGIIEYYQQFMETIYCKLGGQFPVWGISHAGHVKVPENYRIPKLVGNEQLYSLQGQLEHKLAFIDEWVPEDVSLILIGHSIGCHIALNVMQRLPERRILKSILLFPTIERLADSPQGKWAWPVVAYFRPLVLILVYFLSYLSTPMQYNLLEWYFSGLKLRVPACAYTASINVFDTHCTNKWMYMAKTEMELVLQLNPDLIRPNLKRLIFYYGASDHWCPVEYYENVKKHFPEGDVRLCNQNFDHAFVLQSSVQVGEMVSQWIAEGLSVKLETHDEQDIE